MRGIAGLHCRAVNGAAAAHIRTALPQDASALASLYQSVRLTEQDVAPKLPLLPPGGEPPLAAFARRGGMFQVPGYAAIRRQCDPRDPRFVVAVQEGQVCGLMRFREDTAAYGQLASRFPGAVDYVELAVRSPAPHLVYPLLLAAFRALHHAGCSGLLFQIYHLTALQGQGQSLLLGLDNGPSRGLNLKIGAVRVGVLAEKQVALGMWRVTIRPDVYHLSLPSACGCLETLCQETDWRLEP